MFYPNRVGIRNGIRKCFNALAKKVNAVRTVREIALEYMEVVGMLAKMHIKKHFRNLGKFSELTFLFRSVIFSLKYFSNISLNYFSLSSVAGSILLNLLPFKHNS